ncbi:MAG: hypothetical protein GX235_11895 [Clostridiales bacterium]|nr:hypothetical protein [Clostridiales bacterium]
MKLKVFLLLGIIISTLCGCAAREESKETSNQAAVEQEAAVEPEATVEPEAMVEPEATVEPEVVVEPESIADLSWALKKEIDPMEKKMESRYVGFFNENLAISTYQHGVLHYTTDGGELWSLGSNSTACITGLDIIDDKVAYIAANYSQVATTSNGGKTWSRLPDFGNMANGHCRYLSFIDENTGWIANRKDLGFTKDGGKSWETVSIPEGILEISAIWLSSATKGYILSSKGTLYKTTDGGLTWTEKDLKIEGFKRMDCPTMAFRIAGEKTLQVVAYLEKGKEKGYYYFYSDDGGDTWKREDLVLEGGKGYVYLNREGTMLTISDMFLGKIQVYELVNSQQQ